jgi:hypothetical protein
MFNGTFLIWLCLTFFCVKFIFSAALIGTFNDLDHHQVASVVSCFVPCEKSSEQIRLRNELSKPMTTPRGCKKNSWGAYLYHHCFAIFPVSILDWVLWCLVLVLGTMGMQIGCKCGGIRWINL